MEELKNENVTEQPGAEEHTPEQRPSTKYGRTAYQQQMQEEQGEMEQKPYQWNTERPYDTYAPYEEPKTEVKQAVGYILMVLVAVSSVVGLVYNSLLSRVYSMGDTLEEIVDVTITVSQEPVMVLLSTITDILFWAIVVCIIIDIIQLRKAGKNITGAILFAIFLRPAYFIWRAHLLAQKKLVPIIYAIAVYLIFIAQIGVILAASTEMVMRTMF